MERWRDRVAIVTGASAGIGWAIARALIEADLYVVGLARRHERMLELRDSQLGSEEQRKRFTAIACDLSDLDSIRAAFEQVERLPCSRDGVHVLINNAGMASYSRLLDEGNEKALQRTMDVNLMGSVHCAKQTYRLMQPALAAGQACHVINVCSLLGHRIPPHIPGCGFNLYPVAKHALRALNEVLRREFQPHKLLLRLSNISPGLTHTEFSEAASRNSESTAEATPSTKQTTSTSVSVPEFGGAWLQPEDVARGVLFILGSPQHVSVAELLMVPTCEEY
ncbi:farnesol dehydrogenase-like [Scaptodrosophila lebanonensis]|uniref:Farnesol dehydrogenase-like n=1 Tax=Drosophila lebanonensis TaxID=7225 RepID=A0A6J2TSJ2_DROLE|nr:farnesol dehydrogenase-like [Scaptodrosophila lebanonensis]